MNIQMDLDQINSADGFDPFKKRIQHRLSDLLLPQNKRELEDADTSNDEEGAVGKSPPTNITIWTHTETLALINIFSLFKDKFKSFKKKKEQWKFISEELAKIGIHKIPEKCEIKWKNLLRVYRQHQQGTRAKGKFEFYNELNHIVANDNQYKYVIQYTPVKGRRSNSVKASDSTAEQPSCKKTKCRCMKSEKQKRHDDRMAIMVKKMELEERKVKAFEDYVRFLKANIKRT